MLETSVIAVPSPFQHALVEAVAFGPVRNVLITTALPLFQSLLAQMLLDVFGQDLTVLQDLVTRSTRRASAHNLSHLKPARLQVVGGMVQRAVFRSRQRFCVGVFELRSFVPCLLAASGASSLQIVHLVRHA